MKIRYEWVVVPDQNVTKKQHQYNLIDPYEEAFVVFVPIDLQDPRELRRMLREKAESNRGIFLNVEWAAPAEQKDYPEYNWGEINLLAKKIREEEKGGSL